MLTSDLDANNLTADRFWNSQFGKILLSGVSLPDVTQTLFDMFSGDLLSGVSQASIVEVLIILLVMRLEAPNLPIREDGRFRQIAYEAFRRVRSTFMTTVYRLEKYDIVQLHSGNLAMMANNGCETGDEVWIVLGCHFCITLRPQPSRVYLHSRPAVIPAWEQYENFMRR